MLSFGALAAKVFGSANDRKIKSYRPTVDEINALEPELEKLTDAELRARTETFRKQLADGTDARRPAGPGLRHRARGGQAHARPAPFRRADDRRHGPAPGQDRRDEDRRRQDAGRHACRLPQRPAAARRPRRHGQRLPRQARRRMDGPHLQVPRPDRRLHRARARRRPAARAVRLRRHLRHQQRAGLRLPARQHEDERRRDGAARACLRHRRRGGLDPDRRGAHAAHHLRPGRGSRRALQRHRRADAAGRRGALRARREAAPGFLHRGRQRVHRAGAAREGSAQGRRASTTSRTSPSCTTPTRRSRPTSCSCATATTSSKAARSSSSTSSPAA